MKEPLHIVSITLALATLIASCTVATLASGAPWRTVRILQLRNYGGVDNSQFAEGEWWRLITAQFVHVQQAHMLFNVVAIFLIGVAVERMTGPLTLLLVWLMSGIAGMFASIYAVAPPYDVGSGASQALMGITAASIVLMWRRPDRPRWLMAVVLATITIQLALDLASAHRPKPGHMVGFFVGLILALASVSQRNTAIIREGPL